MLLLLLLKVFAPESRKHCPLALAGTTAGKDTVVAAAAANSYFNENICLGVSHQTDWVKRLESPSQNLSRTLVTA